MIKWSDDTTNLCSIFDFWLRKTLFVRQKLSTTDEMGKITKVLDSQNVIVSFAGKKFTMLINDLEWLNRSDFTGDTLTWASDETWRGTVIEQEYPVERYNVFKYGRGKIHEKENVDIESNPSASETSDTDEEEIEPESWSSEDDTPLAQLITNCQNDGESRERWSFRAKKLPDSKFTGQRDIARGVKTPIEYFEQYFDEAFVKMICDESNKYSKVKNINSNFNLHPDEFKLYMANLFYMSLFGMNNVRRYWHTNSRIALIADSMALNRFEEIRRYIHFTSSTNQTDKFHKFRPILNQFQKVASSLPKDEHCSVDENTIPYKGNI